MFKFENRVGRQTGSECASSISQLPKPIEILAWTRDDDSACRWLPVILEGATATTHAFEVFRERLPYISISVLA